MYVGRVVLIGRLGGRSWAGYRVSSRSFPNRRAEVQSGTVLVSPRDPQDLAKNPYIAYHCLRTMKNAVVVANGTHADMIAERMEDGSSPLDALGLSLLAFGYERDELKTPRIAGVMRDAEGWLGIAKDGELRAKRFSLEDGDAFYVATYERTEFEPIYIAGDSALALAKASFGLPFERPVCSAAALQDEDGFKLAVYNPR